MTYMAVTFKLIVIASLAALWVAVLPLVNYPVQEVSSFRVPVEADDLGVLFIVYAVFWLVETWISQRLWAEIVVLCLTVYITGLIFAYMILVACVGYIGYGTASILGATVALLWDIGMMLFVLAQVNKRLRMHGNTTRDSHITHLAQRAGNRRVQE